MIVKNPSFITRFFDIQKEAFYDGKQEYIYFVLAILVFYPFIILGLFLLMTLTAFMGEQLA